MSSSIFNSGNEKDSFEFNCPECGTLIKDDTSKCPKCGIEFVIEEISEGECPECGMMIPVESDLCPFCKVDFMDEPIAEKTTASAAPVHSHKVKSPEDAATREAMKTQYNLLVKEIQPLLEIAKGFQIDMTEYNKLLSKAERAEKMKNLTSAVRRVKICRSAIRLAIEERIYLDIENLERKASKARSIGASTVEMTKSLDVLKGMMASNYFRAALEESRKGRDSAEKVIGKHAEAHSSYEGLNQLIQKASQFNVDVKDARNILKEAKEAGEKGNWETVGTLSRKGYEGLVASLPEILKNEMNKAKSTMLSMKPDNKNLSAMMKALKEAGAAMKNDKYDGALDKMIEFKNLMKP